MVTTFQKVVTLFYENNFTNKKTLNKLILKKIKIGLIENDFKNRDAIISAIKASKYLEYIFSSISLNNFLKYSPPKIDIVLIGSQIPNIIEIDGISKIKYKLPHSELVIFSHVKDREMIVKSFRAGATGYILKEEAFETIEQLLYNSKHGIPVLSPFIAKQLIASFAYKDPINNFAKLTKKEIQVLTLLLDGLSYKLVASELNNSVNSIRYHIKNIYKKFKINSRTELFKLYLDGYIQLN